MPQESLNLYNKLSEDNKIKIKTEILGTLKILEDSGLMQSHPELKNTTIHNILNKPDLYLLQTKFNSNLKEDTSGGDVEEDSSINLNIGGSGPNDMLASSKIKQLYR